MPAAWTADTAHAWVESPFQLLGAIEAHVAGAFEGRRLVVLPRHGVEPLVRTVAELRRLGLPPGLEILPPGRRPRRGSGLLAIGDAFSGEVHRLLLNGLPEQLVLLDDGRSTRRAMEALVTREVPLVRPHVAASPARALLARATAGRLRRLSRRGRVGVVTALDLPERVLRGADALNIRVQRHDFAWLRELPPADAPGSETVVLGTSLVANGLVKAEPYLEWVRAIARVSPVSYWAHRREDARTMDALARTPAVQLVSGEVPVELSLRGVTSHRLITLPTTAATTLRLLSPSVRIHEYAVPADWWLPHVPAAARQHLVPDPEAGAVVDLTDGSGVRELPRPEAVPAGSPRPSYR
jgi:hypothetical protein